MDIIRGKTRFKRTAPGRFDVFELDECEVCGQKVQAPNRIGLVCAADLLLVLGAIRWDAALPPELYATEAGGSACEECFSSGKVE